MFDFEADPLSNVYTLCRYPRAHNGQNVFNFVDDFDQPEEEEEDEDADATATNRKKKGKVNWNKFSGSSMEG